MAMKSKPKTKEIDRGKFPKKQVRPTALDLAALDVLTRKLNLPEADVWRIALTRMVDFEGVREQVTERARQYA
jgi:hypothetical protein